MARRKGYNRTVGNQSGSSSDDDMITQPESVDSNGMDDMDLFLIPCGNDEEDLDAVDLDPGSSG